MTIQFSRNKVEYMKQIKLVNRRDLSTREQTDSFFVDLKKSQKNTPPSTPSIEGGGGCNNFKSVETEKKNNVQTILEQAQQLSQVERKQLLAKLVLTDQKSKNWNERDVDMWVMALYNVLLSVSGGASSGLAGPAVIKRLIGTFNAFSPVSDFMASAGFEQLTVLERQSVYLSLAALVVTQAQSVARHASIPLSVKLVANCAQNVAALFEQAFPGYLASGLALVVARRIIVGGNVVE